MRLQKVKVQNSEERRGYKNLIYIALSTEEVVRNSVHWPILQRLEPDFKKIFVFCWGKRHVAEERNYCFYSGNILTWLPVLWRIKNIGLIYGNDYFIGGYLGTLLKHWKKAPLLTRIGSPWVYEKKTLTNLFKKITLMATKKMVLHRSDTIVYNSHSIVEKNIQHDYKVVYNGVDLTLFRPTNEVYPPKGNLRLLYIGNINVEKGIIYLLDAAMQLSDKVSLTIVGSGPLQKEYQHKFPSINFVGRVPRTRIPEIINNHDLFILPTFVESFPNVLLEAMACAKPVIATKVYGIPEMIENNHSGILIPQKDTSAIAEAILSLIEKPARRKELGQKALDTVRQRFDQEKQLQELYSLIKNIITKGVGER